MIFFLLIDTPLRSMKGSLFAPLGHGRPKGACAVDDLQVNQYVV